MPPSQVPEVALPAEGSPHIKPAKPLDDKEEDTSFPWRQMTVLAFCRLAEPIAFSSISSYSFKMVQHIRGPEQASFYSGLLITAFALPEALAAMIWGTLSDRWGRKPIILLALTGNVCSSLMFGFSTNYWVAFTARVLGGILNGNISVMQTMVAEIATRPEHEPIAYAMQPFVWSVGAIAGASLGGFAAEPANSYPNTFSQDGLFGKYPYLLPNLIAASLTALAVIQGLFFLEETCEVVKNRHKQKDNRSQSYAVDETAPLLDELTSEHDTRTRTRRFSSLSQSGIERALDTTKPSDPSTDPPSNTRIEPTDPGEVKAFTKEVILWTIELFLMSYHQIAFNYILTIFMLDQPRQPPHHLDLVGGLGRTLPQVGTVLAIESLISILVQGMFYPFYVKWVGVWKATFFGSLLAPFVHAALPFITLLSIVDIGIYGGMFLFSISNLVVFPCLLILLKDAAPSISVLGRVNGLALALCSGGRTLAPPILGLFYSAFGSAAAWWQSAFVAALAFVLLMFIPRPKAKIQDPSMQFPTV